MAKGWRFSKAFGRAGRLPNFEDKNYGEWPFDECIQIINQNSNLENQLLEKLKLFLNKMFVINLLFTS
jgi:hypothetical protein